MQVLTEGNVFRIKIDSTQVDIMIWSIVNVITTEKQYRISDAEAGYKALTNTTLLLADGKTLVLPGPNEKDYDDQYKNFVDTIGSKTPRQENLLRRGN